MSKGSYAQATIVGRATADATTRTTQGGKSMATFTIAVTTGWGNNEKGEFYRVTVWGDQLVERVGQWVVKGARVLVLGELGSNEWTTQSGDTRRDTTVTVGFGGHIEFLDTKAEREQRDGGGTNDGARSSGGRSGGYNRDDQHRGGGQYDDLDDDVPF